MRTETGLGKRADYMWLSTGRKGGGRCLFGNNRGVTSSRGRNRSDELGSDRPCRERVFGAILNRYVLPLCHRLQVIPADLSWSTGGNTLCHVQGPSEPTGPDPSPFAIVSERSIETADRPSPPCPGDERSKPATATPTSPTPRSSPANQPPPRRRRWWCRTTARPSG